MNTKKTIHRLSTVDNAISLLAMFLKYDSVGLMDVERELGISKTAAFRLAATMTDRGFLIKNTKTKQYYPGPILFQLVQKFQVNDITTVAQPFIQELAQLTNESIYLSIRSGNSYIFLTGVDSIHPVKVTIPFGDEIDLYVGAAGKVHMAYMSTVDIDTYFKRTEFEKNSSVSIENLKVELIQIRDAGYSTSFGEAYPDSGGIAVPIWGLSEEPIAVLGLFLPMTRLPQDKRDQLIKLVIDFAEKISAEFIRKQETIK
ncbi:IclR family transcriptional regulator [Neobacillus kokaensis]|uniref:IclR family transcriptional regulator n=1 Tax=Neobacillus kokaensis TaxID=2759023 RepID=A0ABQ3MYT7_9BACI|nr:IclR family transcriptional regulator [Neobacillus kokaensis]GHH96780.1 IclR family transcriptional regulator [Neobacillus kokaensis]